MHKSSILAYRLRPPICNVTQVQGSRGGELRAAGPGRRKANSLPAHQYPSWSETWCFRLRQCSRDPACLLGAGKEAPVGSDPAAWGGELLRSLGSHRVLPRMSTSFKSLRQQGSKATGRSEASASSVRSCACARFASYAARNTLNSWCACQKQLHQLPSAYMAQWSVTDSSPTRSAGVAMAAMRSGNAK